MESLPSLTSFWLLVWNDLIKLLMFVSAASSKDVPCKGESLGNHIEGLEIQLKDILMIAQAK